jgi:CRP-like cAMP-binding protein
MDRLAFLQTINLFAGVGEEDLKAISSCFSERYYPRRSIIFFQSDEGDKFYIVKSGSVKIFRITEDGREITFDVMTKGNFFGEMALLDGYSRSATAQTNRPRVVLEIEGRKFQDFTLNTPAFAMNVIKSLSMRIRWANERIENLVFNYAYERIVNLVAKLGKMYGVSCPEGIKVELKFTHQELASLAGTSRETVTRSLLKMRKEGLLELKDRYLIIKDPGFAGRDQKAVSANQAFC